MISATMWHHWRTVLWAAALNFAAACSGGAVVDADVSADAVAGADATADVAQCHEKQRKTDGSCWPVGQFYDFASDTCAAVGPPECAENIFTNLEKCTPKWCWDWQDADKKPCKAWSDGCETAGRSCTSEEIADGGGCPAGRFPVSAKPGDCAAVGFWAKARLNCSRRPSPATAALQWPSIAAS